MYASNVPLPPYPVRVLQGGPGVGVPFHSPLLHPLSGGWGGRLVQYGVSLQLRTISVSWSDLLHNEVSLLGIRCSNQ